MLIWPPIQIYRPTGRMPVSARETSKILSALSGIFLLCWSGDKAETTGLLANTS